MLDLPAESFRTCGEPAKICLAEGSGEIAYACSWCADTNMKFVGWEEIQTDLTGKTCQAKVGDGGD